VGMNNITKELTELYVEKDRDILLRQEDRHSFFDERIKELEHLMERADVVEPSGLQGGPIQTGAVVKLLDVEFDEEVEYTVVNRYEADPLEHKLSEESPVGKAL